MENKFGIINNIKHVTQHADSKPTPINPKKAKGFQDLLKSGIAQVNQEQKVAEKALGEMATGQIKDLHQAAIAIGKAEASMKVMLEVRNKAISAYKEILRTQV